MPDKKSRSNSIAPNAKGDLVIGTGSAASGVLAVGSTDQVLTADSSTSTGLKWAAVPATNKSFSLLNAGGTTLSGTSTGVTGLSGYDTLILLISNGSTNGNHSIDLYINNDGSNLYGTAGAIVNMNSTYSATQFTSTGTADGTANRWALGATGGAAAIFSTAVTITGANSTGGKGVQSIFGTDTLTGQLKWMDGVYMGSSVISSLYITTSAGSFDAGKIYVYGSVA